MFENIRKRKLIAVIKSVLCLQKIEAIFNTFKLPGKLSIKCFIIN